MTYFAVWVSPVVQSSSAVQWLYPPYSLTCTVQWLYPPYSLTCKYQGFHSLVKLPPFRKWILSTFNNRGSHV